MKTIFMRLIAACLLVVSLALAVAAQSGPDYEAWTRLAERAESVIVAGRASDADLEVLRSDIAEYRAEFLSTQSENGPRIATLESQLTALGEVPQDVAEPEEIAIRRAELTEQLASLRAPIRRAEEAYTRADGLIREIDVSIRDRQADALLELGPTPLNPQSWRPALDALIEAIWRPVSEVQSSWNSDIKRAELRGNLPLVLTLVVFAVVLVLRGSGWIVRIVNYMRNLTGRGAGVWSFFVSLGQILLPFIGLIALSEAASATGLFGLRGMQLLDQVPQWGLIILFIRWLADYSFSRDEDVATIRLESWRRAEARWYFNLLGSLLVVRSVLDAVTVLDNLSDATTAVLDFPILVTTGLILFRLGQILIRVGDGKGLSPEVAAQEDTGSLRFVIAKMLGRVVLVVAVVGPVMAAIGYGNVGTALVYPTILTLILVAAVLVAQRFARNVYQLISGETVSEQDSLILVLANFAMTVLAMPVLALIWGARIADLTELWATFLAGFQFGNTRISPVDFLTFAVVFALGYSLTRLMQKGLRGSVLPKTNIDPGGQTAIVSGLGYVGVFLASIVAITAAGLDLSSLAIVAGALSVGIGFGLQNIVQNFVSGIILLIERPIAEGDWIEVGPHMGIVKNISVRSTRIETFDRTDVIIPNGDFIAGTVTNYTRGNTIGRVFASVGVAYGTDTRKVESILLRIARENEYVLTNPEPSVVFARFGADALEFEVRAILRDVNKKLLVLSDMNHEIAARFAEEGIEIPFAQRDVWLRNPEVLNRPAAEADPEPNTPPQAQSA